MKKYIVLLGITMLLGVSPSIFAQYFDPPIMPDSLYYSSSSSVHWFRNGTAFCYFNGANYAFVWKSESNIGNGYNRWYPFVYILQDNELVPFETDNTNKLSFGYFDEDEYVYGTTFCREDVHIYGTSYAFSYFGYLWYSVLIQQPVHPFVCDPDVWYQLWARYDPTTNKWTTWYNYISPHEPENYNLGACQVDSLLYMAYWDGSSESIRVARYTYDQETKDISYLDPVDIRLPAKKFGGMFAYKDTEGNTNMVYNTSTETEGVWVTYDGPVIGHHDWVLQGVNAGFSVMMQGSAQGMRSSESSFEGNRFNVFYLGSDPKEDGSFPLYDWEWIIPQNYLVPPRYNTNREVTLPASHPARRIDGHWQLGWTYAMVPMDFSAQLDSADGLSKKLMVFYPDIGARLIGTFFNSDNWRPVPNSVVSATDLGEDDIYGPEIRKLWTLVGITDGAPPCSINWDVWESTLLQHEPSATEFTFTTTTSETSSVSTTYQDSYCLGGSINVGPQNIGGGSIGFKYSEAFKSIHSSGTTIKTQISTDFILNKETQQYGYYIWSIPQINRITYEVYPWFDNSGIAPVAATTQYRFITQGATLVKESIPINEFPFSIDDPNDSVLYDFTENERQEMANSALYHNVSPLGEQGLYWSTTSGPGEALLFSQVNTSLQTMDTTNSYTWNESAVFGCPGIFKVSANSTQAVSYSSRYSYETTIGDAVTISLKHLVSQSHGIIPHDYKVLAYWFKPEKADWWYFDGLEGQRPWYIGYIVTELHTQLILLSPDQASILRSSDLLFSWKAEDGELSDYDLFICLEPTSGPGSTIYKLPCGNKTSAVPEGFTPEQGITYYWLVRGHAQTGETVWSRPRAFKVDADHAGNGSSFLPVAIYPNPTRNGTIYVSYDLPEESRVSMSVYDINGQLIQQNEQIDSPAGITTRQIELEGYAPGIYVVRIKTDKASVIKKLIIK